jgi:peptidyl-lysine (3S)-dioxygenase / protease
MDAGIPPDAVNLWIGDGRSITSIHSGESDNDFTQCMFMDRFAPDPYENIYCVIRGKKIFTLFPPSEGWLLEGVIFIARLHVVLSVALAEREYPHATYIRSSPSSDLEISPTGQAVRWSSISDPVLYPPPGTHPIHIEVEAGDTLYLPAGWWHDVRQSGSTIIALNWWYDMEMSGMSWVTLSFLRGVHLEGNDDVERECL